MALFVTIQNQEVRVGDTVAIHQNIKEGGKSRIQVFEGVVIGVQNRQENKSFTVRKIATASIGVERIIPVNLPSITKVEVKRHGQVRRGKLYYLRARVGKKTRLKEQKATFNDTKATASTNA